MQIIELSEREQPIDEKSLIKKKVYNIKDYLLIEGDVYLTYKGNIVGCQLILKEEETKEIRKAVRSIKYNTSKRTAGLTSTSNVFGYMPRRKIFNDFCGATNLAYQQPKEFKVLCDFAEKATEIYFNTFPEDYKKHKKKVEEEILTDWTLPGGVFTSGIVNKNNELAYHRDNGNYKNVKSNMLVLRDGGAAGGYLILPKYKLKLSCPDNSFIIFDGESILHGVSGIQKPYETSVRYSIVFYTLSQMKNCLCRTEELKRFRSEKNKTEFKRLDPEHNKKIENISKNLGIQIEREKDRNKKRKIKNI